MNAVQRFFRRYILSTVGIVLLFFAVNIALLFVIIIAGGMSGADTSFSVRDFSDHVVLQDGKWVADDTALSMLQEQSAWAMLLNEDGDVIWQQSLPEKLPRSYTSTEVASFSRWYLEDYPVKNMDACRWQAHGCRLSARNAGKILFFSGMALHGGFTWWNCSGFYHQSVAHYFPDFAKYAESRKSDDAHSARHSKFKSRKSSAFGGTGGIGRDQRRVEPCRRLYEAKR